MRGSHLEVLLAFLQEPIYSVIIKSQVGIIWRLLPFNGEEWKQQHAPRALFEPLGGFFCPENKLKERKNKRQIQREPVLPLVQLQ